jgi:hypothetical protein
MDDSTERSDRFLVARMLRGDESAFASFFDGRTLTVSGRS